MVLEEWMVSQIALHTNATFNSFQLMQVEMLEDLKQSLPLELSHKEKIEAFCWMYLNGTGLISYGKYYEVRMKPLVRDSFLRFSSLIL